MKRILPVAAMIAAILGGPAAAQTQPTGSASAFMPGMRSVKIQVEDFDRATAFYSALGMKPGTVREATRDMVWDQPTMNSGIVMVTPQYAERAKMSRGGTYLMIITPDVNAVIARLERAGFPDVGQPSQMGTMVTVLMLKDPDGNHVELMGPPAAN